MRFAYLILFAASLLTAKFTFAGCTESQVKDLVSDHHPAFSDCYQSARREAAYGGYDRWFDHVSCRDGTDVTLELLTNTTDEDGDCHHPLFFWYTELRR